MDIYLEICEFIKHQQSHSIKVINLHIEDGAMVLGKTWKECLKFVEICLFLY